MLSIYTGVYPIGVLAAIITVSIVAPFFDIPSLKKRGRISYYSSLFLAEKPKDGLVKIHGGTLFDYCFVIDRKMNGTQRTNFIIQQYVDGLLAFLEVHKHDTHLKIRGTSYMINERTAKKIGFEIVETDILQKALLAFNYCNVLISHSIAKNKLSFPNLKRTKTFEADIGRLMERKAYMEQLNQSLKG